MGLNATKTGMKITFGAALDPQMALDPKNYAVQTWSLKRSANYGSKHYDEKRATVIGAKVSKDGKTVTLEIADMRPTWCMEIRYHLATAAGTPVQGVVHNTIHRLSD